MADKKLVAATVRSRELGMQKRINQVTTSSHIEWKKKMKKEEKNRIHISFKSKESKRQYITKDKKYKKEEKEDAAAGSEDTTPQCDEKAEAARKEDTDSLRKGVRKAAAAKPRLKDEVKRHKELRSLYCKKT